MNKPLAKVEHLANWYFGTFCVRCAKIEMDEWNHGKNCWDKIHEVAENLKTNGTEEMTHKEFVSLIKKGTTFCKPVKRKFHECKICKALGIPQRGW